MSKLHATRKFDSNFRMCMGTTSPASGKIKRCSTKRQGTTLVVPQMHQNEPGALAPEGCLSRFLHKNWSPFAARLLCVLTLLLVSLPSHPQAAHYRITGTVVNASSGEPVQRVTVAALSASDHRTVALVETGNDGHFALEGLAAAKYDLAAYRRGFLLSLYNQHELFNTAIVTGEGQQTVDLVFRITPAASLHGVVTSDDGDPVEGAKVLLFLKPGTHNSGVRIIKKDDTTTDDTGAYEFGDLALGEYFVAVTAKPWYALHHSALRQKSADDPITTLDVAYPVTFFDSTTDEASATSITLAGGSHEEANINLHAVPALHLTVNTPGEQYGSTAPAELRQVIFGLLTPSETATPQPPTQAGTTEFIGVAPGHYELTQGNPPRIAELDSTASMHVDANLGKPAMDISGTLRTASGSALPGRVTLSLEPLDGVYRQEPISSDSNNGQFTFESIRQGNWNLTASTQEKQLPIASITIGNRTHPGNQITVSDKPLQLVVTLSLSETRIEGFARKADKDTPGVMVVLIPKELAAFPALARRDQSDSDGSFALRDVVPGQYTVVAIENGWDLDWARPEVISRYLPGGVPVTVTESSGKLVRLSQAVQIQSQ